MNGNRVGKGGRQREMEMEREEEGGKKKGDREYRRRKGKKGR